MRQLRIFSLLSFLMLSLAPIRPVYGLSAEFKSLLDRNIRNYNEEQEECASGSGLVGGDAPEKIWNFFIGKGFSPPQVAGIMGNMQAESGFEPKKVQYGTRNSRGEISEPGQPSSLDDNPASGGYGLVQFTPGTKILADSDRLAKSPGDLEFQITLIWEQLSGGSAIPEKAAGDHLKQTSTVEDATVSFLEKYERAGEKKTETRIQFAKSLLIQFGSQSATGAPTTSSSGCGGGVCIGTGVLPLPADLVPVWFNYDAHNFSVSWPRGKDSHRPIIKLGGDDFGATSVANSTFQYGEAVDVGVPNGSPVFSPTDGTVIYVGSLGSAGEYLIIESSDKKCVSLSAHLRNLLIKKGDLVTPGQPVGEVTTLAGNGPTNGHLHFELWVNGEPINIGEVSESTNFNAKAEEIWEKQKSALLGGGVGQ